MYVLTISPALQVFILISSDTEASQQD